ncbi:MAG: class I SAM-dependent methyltransferase [Methanobrevibacter sp.]|nr:class I SAM-dependent methyltransferase [Methanobrevibacter sp.]
MECTNDLNWDRKLNISTEIIDYSKEDDDNYGYDPTPYVVLQNLIKLDILKKEDIIVDYGCGKGRIGFFLNNQIGYKVVGIDHDERMIEKANENLKRYGNNENIIFIHSKAEDYIPDESNCFYFFNPFSTKIFRKVLERIGESYKRRPREILIFFYYSTIEYKLYLPSEPRLELIESLDFSEEEINNDMPAKLSIFRFHPI